MPQVARVGDSVSANCAVDGLQTGTFSEGQIGLDIAGVNVVLVGHKGTLTCGHQFQATGGSAIGDYNGTPIVRVGDPVVVLVVGGTGTVTSGSPVVDLT